MNYKINIGLEVHIELCTKNKMFCICKNKFSTIINENICPICTGEPGTMPIFNNNALDLAIKLGIATNSSITKTIQFDRKCYFYKDLPKSYQITQFFYPICKGGYIDIGNKKITIKEIHMEEDACKIKDNIINYNRAGVPLLELVTYPILENYDEVIKFLNNLREILVFLNISDAKIEEGSMRVDINLSVRKSNIKKLGTRTEIKNIGSFKSIKNAIKYEVNRHIELIENEKSVNCQTRKFSEKNNITIYMREKESPKDYLYINEPDILPIILNDCYIDNIKNNLEILPNEKRALYKDKYALNDNDINLLIKNNVLDDIFLKIVSKNNMPKETINIVATEISSILNINQNISITDNHINNIVDLIDMFYKNKITRNTYKDILSILIIKNVNPIEYVEKHNLYIISDSNIIKDSVKKVLNENPKSIKDYKDGKEKALKYLIGQTMKKLQNKADIHTIIDIIIDNINTNYS